MSRFFRFFAVFAAFFATNQQLPGDPCEDQEKFAVYFVIDRSGSMLRADYPLNAKNQMRIEGAKAWAKKQAQLLDLGTHVWVLEFEGNEPGPALKHHLTEIVLKTEADRAELIKNIEGIKVRHKNAGTALYDSTAYALDHAMTMLEKGWVVSVITLTDGQDSPDANISPPQQGSVKYRIDNQIGLPGLYAHEDFRVFQRRNSRATLVHELFGGENKKTADLPLTVRVTPAEIILPQDPVVESNPTIELCISIPGYDGSRFLEAGFEMVQLSVPSDSPIKLKPIEAIEFKEGPVKVPIEILNPEQLPEGRDRLETELLLTFPERVGKKNEWAPRIAGAGMASNVGRVKLVFQTGDKPVIGEVTPNDGDRFLAGSVDFRANVAEGMEVVWQVEGEARREAEFSMNFETAGEKTASIYVTDGVRESDVKTIRFTILDCALSVNPPTEKIVAGEPFTFTAATKGEFSRFVWHVDGQPMDPSLAPELVHTFSEKLDSRTHYIYVEGTPAGFDEPIRSAPEKIEVKLRPNADLEEPSAGRAFFGKPVRFRYSVTGDDVERLDFRLQNSAGETVFSASPPAKLDPSGRFRVVDFPIDPIAPSNRKETFKVLATLRGEGVSKKLDTMDLPFQSELPDLAIEFPDEKDGKIRSGDLLKMELVSRNEVGTKFCDAEWRIGGKPESQTGLTRTKRITGKGDIEISAVGILGDGTRISVAPAMIHVDPQLLKPVSKAKTTFGGILEDADIRFLRTTVFLRHESEGEGVTSRWIFNDEPVPPGQESVEIDRHGENELVLEVTDANGEVKTEKIRFVAKSLGWLVAAMLLAGLVLFFIARIFFLKNKPSSWRLEVEHAPTDTVDPEAAARPARVSNMRRAKINLSDFWSPRHKRAEVDVAKIRPLKKDPWFKTQTQSGYLKITGYQKGTVSKGNLGAEVMFSKIGGGSGDLKSYRLSVPKMEEENEGMPALDPTEPEEDPKDGLVMGGLGNEESEEAFLLEEDESLTNDYLITLNTKSGSTMRYWSAGLILSAILAAAFYLAWIKLI